MNLRQGAGDVNPFLQLLLHRNRLQLATTDALYSDGDSYLPATAAIGHLKVSMPSVKNVLVLGTGLGSLVSIIRKGGYDPHFTLVENDKVVLQWAMEALGGDNARQLQPVCMDAMAFMNRNTALYDLVFIDIFSSRAVPDFVTTAEFLTQCRDCVAPGGHVVFNYMVDDPADWVHVQEVFSEIFVQHIVLDLGINKVFVNY